MSDESEQQNVRVMVRVRPFNAREKALEAGDELKSVVLMDGNKVTVLDPEHQWQERDAFEFDECFWSIPEEQNIYTTKPFANQEDVFVKTGMPAVENAMRGYHNTIFAYGQTGSGKTHSMLGNDANEGIAPRLVRALFARIAEDRKANPHERVQYSVELSFLEIYNEKVKDLLLKAQNKAQREGTPRGGGGNAASTSSLSMSRGDEYSECRVRQHPEKGTFVEGLMRMLIESEEQCLTAIKEGMEHRAVTSTLMNDTSSRSHAIFQICLTQKSPLKGTSRVSIINLVDLAGSERIKLSGVSGQALQEAKNINLSLSTLRRVIDVLIDNSKLKKGQRGSVPPYRESLLTWVLSDSLGGNSRTVMVAAVSPYAGNLEDTMGTLRYALKAKAIVCHAKVNEEKTAAVVHQLRGEMEALRKKLEEKAISDVKEQERLELALKEREEEWSRMRAESEKLDALRAKCEEELQEKAVELNKAQEAMVALDNVEEERVQKERELAEARSRQEETARLLAEQKEERLRRDAELEAVLARKAKLDAHHDRTAVEEARAKLEAEQARMRQFASAFQSAFRLTKQKSGLDELKAENAALKEKLTSLEVQTATAEKELAVLSTEKQTMERKVELLDRKCQAMLRDLQAVMRGKNERIGELTARKDVVSKELDKLLRELDRRRDEIVKVRQLHHDESVSFAEKAAELKAQQEHCERDIRQREQNIAALQKALDESKLEIARLEESTAAYDTRAEELRAIVETRERTVAELKRQREAHTRQRDEARVQLQERRAELERANVDLEVLKAEVATLQQNHRELRDFVTAHFFPAAGGSGGGGGGNSSGARGRATVVPPFQSNHQQHPQASNHIDASSRELHFSTPRRQPAAAGTSAGGQTTPRSQLGGSNGGGSNYYSASRRNTPGSTAATVAVRQYAARGVRYELNTPSGFAAASTTTASSAAQQRLTPRGTRAAAATTPNGSTTPRSAFK